MKNKYMYIMIIIVVIFSILMLFKKFYNQSQYMNNVSYKIGDVDGNDKVEVTDYILVRKHIIKNPELKGGALSRADVDGVNGVTVNDYIYIKKIILGIANPTPKPTVVPTVAPTQVPTAIPTQVHTPLPTVAPTPAPTIVPTTPAPTAVPTAQPTNTPKPMYVITEDPNVPSKEFTSGGNYALVQSYSSSTFKYKIFKRNNSLGNQGFYAIIWVEDAYNQIKSAQTIKNGKFETNKGYAMLNNEVNAYGYQKKGLIGVNASFYWDYTPELPVIIKNGTVYNNNLSKHSFSSIGFTKEGIFKQFDRNTSAETYQSEGVRNNWAGGWLTTNNWKYSSTSASDHRTLVGQIDANNFVIYCGKTERIENGMKDLHDYFGAQITFNFDGGGSARMYYKNNSFSDVRAIFTAPNDPNKNISDMLYFVEK